MNDRRRYLANGVAAALIVLTAVGILGHSAMSVAAAPGDGPVGQALGQPQAQAAGAAQSQALDPDERRRRLIRLLRQLAQNQQPTPAPAATPTTNNSNNNSNGNDNFDFNDNFNFNDNIDALLERDAVLAAARAATGNTSTGLSSLSNGPTTSSPDSLVQMTVDNPNVTPQVSYDVPPGPADTSLPSAFRVIRQFVVTTTPSDQPAVAKLVLHYADSDVGPGGPSELQVRYYRPSLGTWLAVPSTVDTAAHTVTVPALFASVIEQPIRVALLAPQ